MSKKKTTEQFIEEAIKVHGDKYDYSLVEYIGYDKKVKIICKEHGEFETQARCHLKADCQKCHINNKTTSFNEFVEKANKTHNSKYTYDETSYINTNSKVNILCEHHGWFQQMAHQHLRGSNCKFCTDLLKGNSQRHSQEDFLKRAKETHGDKYGYDKVEYKNASSKVIIFCNECSKFFEQKASLHLRHGCKVCSDKNNGLSLRKTNKQYIEEVVKIHKNFYNYDKTSYIKIFDKITVTCPIHGDFTIRASDHKNGCGCVPCSRNLMYEGWNHTKWVEYGNKSNNFVNFQVYLIKCIDTKTKEEFYKIGKTFLEIKYRFSGNALPYDYEILKVIIGEGIKISKLEKKLHKKYKKFNYKPNKIFGGYTECYKIDLPIEEIIKNYE